MDLDIIRRKMLRSVLRIHWNKNTEDWAEYLERAARKIEQADGWYKLLPWSLQAKGESAVLLGRWCAVRTTAGPALLWSGTQTAANVESGDL